jgi:hypothetical protein
LLYCCTVVLLYCCTSSLPQRPLRPLPHLRILDREGTEQAEEAGERGEQGEEEAEESPTRSTAVPGLRKASSHAAIQPPGPENRTSAAPAIVHRSSADARSENSASAPQPSLSMREK